MLQISDTFLIRSSLRSEIALEPTKNTFRVSADPYKILNIDYTKF